jgi:hypothetical protein
MTALTLRECGFRAERDFKRANFSEGIYDTSVTDIAKNE